jgi:tripartite-type tricarboxylate transporter receptor subunit TctC
MDIVNPYFRTADYAKLLAEHGIELISSSYANSNVEAVWYPTQAARVFDDPGLTSVIDLGGDDCGALALGRYAGRMQGRDDIRLLLVVNPSGPAKNLTGLIGYARSKPGALSFASAGVGSVSHLAGELFKQEAKIDILHVPYKGGGAAVPDLLAGRVSMMLETIPNALPLVRSGQMRAIGVTTRERSSLAPDIPTLAESGLPGFDVSAWTGLFVPAGTPAAIVNRLNVETRQITHDQKYVTLIHGMGTDVASSSPQDFGQFVRADITRWKTVVKNAGIPRIE